MALLSGLFFGALGILAYTGVWKGWIRVVRGFGSTIGFACLWVGLAFLAGVLASAVDGTSAVASTILFVVAAILLGITVVGLFWLPQFLLPRWYRVLRGEANAAEGERQ